jgi:hypothetical protein
VLRGAVVSAASAGPATPNAASPIPAMSAAVPIDRIETPLRLSTAFADLYRGIYPYLVLFSFDTIPTVSKTENPTFKNYHYFIFHKRPRRANPAT